MKPRALAMAVALSAAPSTACADTANQQTFRVEQQAPARPEPPQAARPEEARVATTSHVETAPPPRRAPHMAPPNLDANNISPAVITGESRGFSGRVNQALQPGFESTTTPNPKLDAIVPNSEWKGLPVIKKSLADGDGEPIDNLLRRSHSALHNLKRDHGILARIDSENEVWFVIPDGAEPTPAMLKQMGLILTEAKHNLTTETKRGHRATEKMISKRRRAAAAPTWVDTQEISNDSLTQVARDLFDDEILRIDSTKFNERLMAMLGQEELCAADDKEGMKKEDLALIDLEDFAERYRQGELNEKRHERAWETMKPGKMFKHFQRVGKKGLAEEDDKKALAAQPKPPRFTLGEALGKINIQPRA